MFSFVVRAGGHHRLAGGPCRGFHVRSNPRAPLAPPTEVGEGAAVREVRIGRAGGARALGGERPLGTATDQGGRFMFRCEKLCSGTTVQGRRFWGIRLRPPGYSCKLHKLDFSFELKQHRHHSMNTYVAQLLHQMMTQTLPKAVAMFSEKVKISEIFRCHRRACK